MQKLKSFKSLQVVSSVLPQTLRNIRADIWRDDWSSLEQASNIDLFLQAILEFLKIFIYVRREDKFGDDESTS